MKDFRAAHIPSGLIERKREEFLALRQGDRSVQEYNLAFVRVARYAPEEVSTEAKRIARFRGGLPRISTTRSPSPVCASSQSSSTRPSGRSQHRRSVPQTRGSRESSAQQ